MRIRSIFQIIIVLVVLCCCRRSEAQTDIYASVITDSSTDFQQAYKTADANRTNYSYISTAATTGTSYLRATLAGTGMAGNAVNIIVQGTGQALTTAILSSITVRLYNSTGTNVANATGSSQLQLYQLSSGNNVYAIRFVTDAAANYSFNQVRVEIAGLLSTSLPEFRVYGIYYQQPCPPVLANSVFTYGTNTLLTGYVDNPNNATDAPTSNFATLTVPYNIASILAPAYLDVSFPVNGKAGDYVGFTVAQASAVLNAALLGNISIAAYSSAGLPVATQSSFTTTDLKDAGSGQYMLGFVTAAGTYNIARVRITLNGSASQTNDINVYNGFHYRMSSEPVAINAAGGLSSCGGTVTLTAVDPSGGTSFAWSNGATTSTITVATSGTYSVQVTDDESCTRYSIPVVVNVYPAAIKPVIAGDTVQCAGAGGMLHTTMAYSSYAWSTGATTPTIATTGGGMYSVIVTDGNGCTARDSVTVIVNTVQPVITGDTVLCTGATGVLHTVATYSSYVWSTGATTPTITISTPGSYSVTVTDATGCTGRDTVIVTTGTPIHPTIVGDTLQCAGVGGTLHTSATYSTYMWSTGATTASIATTGAGIYYVTVTAAGSCPGRDTVTVVVLPAVQPLITGDTVLCLGSTGMLHTAATYTAYLWSTGATTPSITIVTPGSYSVRVTDANGCTGRDTVIVTSTPSKPTITGDTILCPGATGELHTTTTYSTYFWSTGATTPSITITTPGIYIVTVTGATGCTGKDTVIVTVLPQLHPQIVGDTVQCPGNGGELHTSITYSSYLWSTGATTPTIATTGAGLYYVTVGSPLGCPGSDSVTVVVLPGTPPVIAGDTVLCPGTTGSLHTTTSYASYMWSTGATTSSITITNPGLYYVTVTDGTGCTLHDSVTVTAPATSKPVITGDTILCPGATGELHTTTTYTSYVWSTGATTPSITISAAGIYSVTVTGSTGCTGKDTVVVTVLPQLHPRIVGDTVLCPTATGELHTSTSYSSYLWSTGATTASITIGGPGLYYVTVGSPLGCPGRDSVTVTVLPGTPPVIAGDTILCAGGSGSLHTTTTYTSYMWSTGATTPSITITAAGQYNVSVTDGTGCTLHDTVTVITDAIHVVTDSVINVGCASATSGRIVVHGADGTGAYSYLWSNGATTATIAGLAAGSYSVTVTDGIGCTATASATLTQATPPVIALSVTDVHCFGDATGSIAASITNGSGNYTYSWSNGQSTAIITSLAAGTYTLHVRDNTLNCAADDTATVQQPATAVQVQATATNETCAGTDGSIAITATGGTAPYTYTEQGNAASAQVNNLAQGDYSIGVSDANGCSAATTVHVTKNNCDNDTARIRVHNVITPNGDGDNDVLVIGGIDGYAHVSLQIFDKWGDLVYEEGNYHNTWAGTDRKGNDLPSGTYYYLVKLNEANKNGGKPEATGYIMIQR